MASFSLDINNIKYMEEFSKRFLPKEYLNNIAGENSIIELGNSEFNIENCAIWTKYGIAVHSDIILFPDQSGLNAIWNGRNLEKGPSQYLLKTMIGD